jgi:hypothetical protein
MSGNGTDSWPTDFLKGDHYGLFIADERAKS